MDPLPPKIPTTSAPSTTVKPDTSNASGSLNQRTSHSNQSNPTSASSIQARSTQEASLSTQKILRNRSIEVEYKPAENLQAAHLKLNIIGKTVWQSLYLFFAQLIGKANFEPSSDLKSVFFDIASTGETMINGLSNAEDFNKHANQLNQLCCKLGC